MMELVSFQCDCTCSAGEETPFLLMGIFWPLGLLLKSQNLARALCTQRIT